MSSKVAIVVLNWNAWEVTWDCLQSLVHLDYPNYEVIVVDNGSTDGSVEKLRERSPGITILENGHNLGYAGGNNVGLRYALETDAQYVLLLNNDTVVASSCVTTMVHVAEADSRIGILNPTIYYSDPPDRIWYAGGSYSPWWGFARHHRMGQRDCDGSNSTREVTFITGCAFLIKTDVIRRIGVLDERFFMVCEDADWSIRALSAGFKAVYVAEATISHRDSYTCRTRMAKPMRDYYNMRNTLLLARKHARVYHWPSLAACILTYCFCRIAGYSMLGQTDRAIALLRGFKDGIEFPVGPYDMPNCSGNQSCDSAMPTHAPIVALNCLAGFAPNDGSHVYLMALARALSQMDEVDLILFTSGREGVALPRELTDLAYEVNVAAGRSYRQLLQAHRIVRSFRSAKIDLLHLPNTLPFFWWRIPTVITIHDTVDLKLRKYGLLQTAYRYMVNLVASHLADKVITDSESSKRDICKCFRVARRKVVVIFPGVDGAFAPGNAGEDRKAATKQYSVENFFLFPGGFARNKNLAVALLAFAHFRNAGGSHALLVTGEGAPRDLRAAQRKVRELGLQAHVVFTGCLARDKMPAMYRAAAAVLYPSLYEGFGLPILEGMASGCPVIASNTSSLPEAAGDACVLVDPRDPIAIASAMNQVISDSALRQDLIARGLARARAFPWSRTAAETCNVYQEVLGRLSTEAAAQDASWKPPEPKSAALSGD